jgi:hypothetical protein
MEIFWILAVDGAQMARFISKLSDNIEKGTEL